MTIRTMALTTVQLTQLRTELQTDPLTYGYAPLVALQDYSGLSDLVNKVRNGTDGEAAINISRADIDPLELFQAIDVRDFGGSPGVLGGAWFQSLMRLTRIPLLDTAGQPNLIKANLDRYISNGNGSQTRLDALARRFGSRGEQLFGAGTIVTPTNVRDALTLS